MASPGLTSVALHLSCTWKNPEQYETFQMRLPLQTSTLACCDTILDGHSPVKLLQDQGHARGAVAGTWSCVEVPVSPQPRQCHTSAPAAGIHTFPWSRAAAQHQWQQSRTKCQTLLQVSTEVALKSQIKPAHNQRQGCFSPNSPL